MPNDAIPPVPKTDPLAQSADLVAENLAALRGLFPQAFAEGKVDFDVLRELLGDAIEEGEERYGLSWSGKAKAQRHALTPTLATLRPAPEDSVDWDATRNVIVEGDNLEVLKCLAKSYAGEVKLIYIDPPYNTGNDFVYPDDYAEPLRNYLRRTGQANGNGVKNTSNPEVSGRFHTDWLNMMYPRLMLAREMLGSDGVLIASVDEKELQNLRFALDAVLGEENFVAVLTVLCNPKGRSQDKYFATNHEYVVVYSRSQLPKGSFSVDKDDEQLASEYTEEDELGAFRFLELRNTHREFGRFNRRDLYYPLYVGVDGSVSVLPSDNAEKILPTWDDGFEGCWTWGKPKAEKDAAYLVGREVRGRTKVFRKSYASGADRMLKTILNERSYFTERGQKTFNILFKTKAKLFQSPKSVQLICDLIATRTEGNDLILDFFAGSGTTGHAVMAQNAADGGSRRFILVQLPEPLDPTNKDQKAAADFCDALGKPRTIAELTKERLRRAGAEVEAKHPEAQIDTGFRVYKLASSNLKVWQPGEDLEASLFEAADNLLPGRTEDDLLVELLLKRGIDLCEPVQTRDIAGKRVHAFGGGVLVACLAPVADAEAEALANGIADWVTELDPVAPALIFFRDTGFESDVGKLNLEAILRQRLHDRGPGLPPLLEPNGVRSV